MFSSFQIYNFYKNTPLIKQATAPESLVEIYWTQNGLLEKFDFSLPCCSICFTDSKYVTFIEMASVLSEL